MYKEDSPPCTKPTPPEIDAYLAKLRAQASFMRDPALLDAVTFIERPAYGEDRTLESIGTRRLPVVEQASLKP